MRTRAMMRADSTTLHWKVSGPRDLLEKIGKRVWRRSYSLFRRTKLHFLGPDREDRQPNQIHLSWPENPASSICVTWQIEKASQAWDIEYRIVGQSTLKLERARIFPSPGKGFLQRAHVRDLPAEAQIEYRFIGREQSERVSKFFSTHTAPSGHEAGFSFVFFADTGLIGRRDGNATGTEAIYQRIPEHNPLFLIGAGDYAYANNDRRFRSIGDAVDAWFNQAEGLLSRYPLYAQYGNHEIRIQERFEDWATRFAHPAGFDDDRSFSFDVAGVHFAALFMPDVRVADRRHVAWLDADLERARAAGARRLIVFHHEPIYGHGKSHPAAPEIRDMLVPVYDRHRVDLVLNAHDQSYERTYPLVHRPGTDGFEPAITDSSFARYSAWRGVIYAKISPSGKMSEINNDFSRFTVPQPEHIAVWDDTVHHYAVIEVTPESAILVHVIGYDARNHRFHEVDCFQLGCSTDAPPTCA